MTGRFSKLIRNISTSEKKRTESPVAYSFCDRPGNSPPLGDQERPSVARANTSSQAAAAASPSSGREMNILHKAAQHVPGTESRRERKEHKDDKPGKDKHKHGAHKSPVRPAAPKSAHLSVDMESPPLVMYGSIGNSTGALMSGQFRLKVDDAEVRLDGLELQLVIEQTNKKPVEKFCPECTVKKTVLRHWKFTTEPTTFRRGTHQFPFSYLLEGHLPATTDTPLGKITYVLHGNAHQVPRSGSSSSSSTVDAQQHGMPQDAETMTIDHLIAVCRALPLPETDRTAIRVFPPTNLQATCTLPPLIHPITNGFPVLLRLSGVAEHADPGKTVRTWRLKKLTWRLEEQSVVVSQACNTHAPKVGGLGKGIKHESVVALGGKELREGWKADYTPPSLKESGKTSSAGTVEVELMCGPKPRRHDDSRPACDVETPSGFSVRHKLVIECVVTEELHPIDKPKWVAPTGVARILRMGYEIRVTERMGMGISWDEEQPPTYEDVPDSPPGYNRARGPRIDEEVEPLPSGARPIPGRGISENSIDGAFEPPPSYVENRMQIADDEEWDVQRVDFSEGIRPNSGSGDPRSRSRGFSPNGQLNVAIGPGTSGASGMRTIQNARPRLDASDLEIDPLDEMIRGRQREDSRYDDRIGQRDD